MPQTPFNREVRQIALAGLATTASVLAEQDPDRWDTGLLRRGREHLRAAHALGQVGRYQLEAAIQALHCARREQGTTDWAAWRRRSSRSGGAEGNRTPGLLDATEALYQLSYSPLRAATAAGRAW